MALRNPQFPEAGHDPIIAGYERVHSKANGDIINYVHADFKDDVLYETRRRIIAVARLYFPDQFLGDEAVDGRGIALRDGMLIGFMVGRKVVPMMTRYRYYEHVQSHLFPDSEVFRGYHIDTSSIEREIDPRYAGLGQLVELPQRQYVEENQALEAGVGYMATLCALFRENLRWPYLGSMLVRDAHSAQLKRTRKQLERPDTQISMEEITKHE